MNKRMLSNNEGNNNEGNNNEGNNNKGNNKETRNFDSLRAEILKDFPEVKAMVEQLSVVESLVKGMERGSLTPAAVAAELSRILGELEGKIEEDKTSATPVADTQEGTAESAEAEVKTVTIPVIRGPKKVKEEDIAKIALEARNNAPQHKKMSDDLHEMTGKLGAVISKYLEERECSKLLDVVVATNGDIQDFIMEQAIGLIAVTYGPQDIEAMVCEVLSSTAEPGKPITISELNALSYKILAGIDPILLDTARYTKQAVMQLYRKDLDKLTDGVMQEVALSIVASMLTSISVSIMATFAEKAFREVVREKRRAAAKPQRSSDTTGKGCPIDALSGLIGVLLKEVDEAFEAFKGKSSGNNSMN